ncbi:MAG: hypothetical protein AB8U53_00525 [Rickettsia aeschlimannii]
MLPTHPTGSTPVPQYESASITPRTMNAVINTPITATVGGTEPIIIKEYQEHILQNGYSNLYVIRFAIKFDPSDPVSLNSHILPNSISGLTQIEQDIFTYVLHELMLTSPASSIIGVVGPGNFPNNVVLVDFFKRDLGTQQIQIDNITGFSAGIHTVCLLKKENNIVTLIDPNNFIFSNPLENFVKFLGSSLLPSLIATFTIEIEQNIHGNKQKFYKSDPTIPVGRGTNNSRDCTDVAVKIVFKLNEEQQKGIKYYSNPIG